MRIHLHCALRQKKSMENRIQCNRIWQVQFSTLVVIRLETLGCLKTIKIVCMQNFYVPTYYVVLFDMSKNAQTET